jgi:hypothetical protein
LPSNNDSTKVVCNVVFIEDASHMKPADARCIASFCKGSNTGSLKLGVKEAAMNDSVNLKEEFRRWKKEGGKKFMGWESMAGRRITCPSSILT